MSIFAKMGILGAMIALPFAASAQTSNRSDLAYCEALSDTYVRYIGHDENNSHRGRYVRGNLESQVAVAKCKAGDTAAAIPVLERVLTANKFTLPARG